MKVGEIKDSLKLDEDIINVESKVDFMLVSLLLRLKLVNNDA
jgi:hypothetical protein